MIWTLLIRSLMLHYKPQRPSALLQIVENTLKRTLTNSLIRSYLIIHVNTLDARLTDNKSHKPHPNVKRVSMVMNYWGSFAHEKGFLLFSSLWTLKSCNHVKSNVFDWQTFVATSCFEANGLWLIFKWYIFTFFSNTYSVDRYERF